MGVRMHGPLVALTLLSAGDGGAIANNAIAWTTSTGKKARIKKIMWRNRTGANASLLVGFRDRTAAGNLFQQRLPHILMVNGVDGELTEDELPVTGNLPDGFGNDDTIPTGSDGNIYVGADLAAAALQYQVILEVEED